MRVGTDAGERRDERRHPSFAVQAGALFVLTVVVHLPALGNGLVWDDQYQVFENRYVRAFDGLRHFWLTTEASDYFPLNFTAHWIEWHLWGENPAGYHAVNLVLHAAAAVVLWRVLARLGASAAWTAAALFAVHPVTVATVAWISELKNVLSLLLCALALLAYLRFEDEGRRGWYAASVATFALALLAKTSVVMLPVLLLLLAWYRRSRVTTADVRRAAPFFALALVLGLVTIHVQQRSGIGAADVRPEGLLSRVLAGAWIVWFYLWKDVVPLRLAMIYPRWHVDPMAPLAWVPLGALIAAALMVHRLAPQWRRAVLVALGAFVIMLAPVLGMIAMAFHQHSLVSDHLQYVALIAPMALVAGGGAMAVRRLAAGRYAAVAVAAGALVTLAALTWQRTPVFANDWTLWTDTVAKNPDAWGAHNGLSEALFERGDVERAAEHAREAVRLAPDQPEPHNNLGRALAALGHEDEAAGQYAEAIRSGPTLGEAHNNLGILLARRGELAAAEREYREALRRRPDYAEAHNNLGLLLASEGHDDMAETEYREALSLKPTYVEARSNLGNLLVRKGQIEIGITELERAVALAPARAELRVNLGNGLAAARRYPDALAQYREAIRLAPRLVEAHYNRGAALFALGRFDEAAAEYRETLRLDPALAAARQALDAALRRSGDAS